MIQDIQPHKYNNDYVKREPQETDIFLIFSKNQALFYVDKSNLELPTIETLKQAYPDLKNEQLTYLFSIDEIGVFTIIKHDILFEEREAFEYKPISSFRTFVPMWKGFIGITANHLYKWYQSNRYCGCCGGVMVEKEDERAMKCVNCGFLDFPKICPVVIVGVINEDKILLTKYANRAFTNYALIAGFCEIGESLEATIAREVKEEAGVQVKNLRYYGSQPWGFSESLLMGFFADLDGDPTITIDEEELIEGIWMNREGVPVDQENGLSLTYTMMQAFKNGEI